MYSTGMVHNSIKSMSAKLTTLELSNAERELLCSVLLFAACTDICLGDVPEKKLLDLAKKLEVAKLKNCYRVDYSDTGYAIEADQPELLEQIIAGWKVPSKTIGEE